MDRDVFNQRYEGIHCSRKLIRSDRSDNRLMSLYEEIIHTVLMDLTK